MYMCTAKPSVNKPGILGQAAGCLLKHEFVASEQLPTSETILSFQRFCKGLGKVPHIIIICRTFFHALIVSMLYVK